MSRYSQFGAYAFYVHAGNIHTDAIETYGPFPGLPSLTYEFLRDGHGDHIFSYSDREPEDIEQAHHQFRPTYDRNALVPLPDRCSAEGCNQPEAAHDLNCDTVQTDHWHDQEGDVRVDGWRRCWNQETNAGASRFGVSDGEAFWTDLDFEVVHSDTIQTEINLQTYNNRLSTETPT